jgi:hypothetical protein
MILNIGEIKRLARGPERNICYFEEVIKDQAETRRGLLLRVWWLLGSICATTYVAD